MSHITHFKKQPVNVQYWDYYILCRLNTDATIALQRMEYWDGTKEDANIHAENLNDALVSKGHEPTQDTTRWIYKSGEELQWELMGAAGERRLPKLLAFLIKDLQYISQRNNPSNTWDRKKQYCFQCKLIQQHINYLSYIIDYFDLPMARLTTVFYAIELLTKEKYYIDKLSVKCILDKIEAMKNDEKLPHFLKNELVKFSQTYSTPDFSPFRNFAEWKAQNCGMHSAETRDQIGKIAESIPQKRGSNSIEDYHNETNIEDYHNESANGENVVTANADANATPTPSENTQETPVAQTEEKPRKPRAPRTPAEGQVTKAQFEAAFKVIDETLQDLHNNPDFHVIQSKAARESVKALIISKGAPKTLAMVIRDMWNEQNKDGTFWWREKGHMTVKAICEQYSSRAPHLTRQPAGNNNKPATSAVDAMQTAMVGVSGLPITRSNGHKLRVVAPVRKPRRKVI